MPVASAKTPKTRGPMSEDARILLAKRKLGEITDSAKVEARYTLHVLLVQSQPSGTPVTTPLPTRPDRLDAKDHEDVAEFLAITEKLPASGIATLAKLVL